MSSLDCVLPFMAILNRCHHKTPFGDPANARVVLSVGKQYTYRDRKEHCNMKLRFSAPVLLIALYARAGTSASFPSQLRRNVQEVADVADKAGQMITPDSVELAMGDECMMMCEVSEG